MTDRRSGETLRNRWDPNLRGEPSRAIINLANRLTPHARILDIGCGAMAGNAIHLARQGFVVDAFDDSPVAVARAGRRATELGVELTIWRENIADYKPVRVYDAVLCRGVLHFLDGHRWDAAFAAIQDATGPGGWNALSVFDDRLPVPTDLAPLVHRVLVKGEIERRYRGWYLAENESSTLCDEHPGGVIHRHSITRVSAQRPRTQAGQSK